MRQLFATAPFTGFGPDPFALTAQPQGQQVQAETVARLRKGIKAVCPSRPGVYGMVDPHGEVIYIGKAKRLRTRLLSYFRANDEQDKTRRILRRTAIIAWEYVPTEFGALLRELALIRRWRPRFNVLGQPSNRKRTFVCIGRPPAPYVFLTTEPARSCQAYFGPVLMNRYTKQAVRLLNDRYRLRDCTQQQKMHFADQGQLFPLVMAAGCLRHEIGTCIGPCAAACTKEEYTAQVRLARQFLRQGDPEYLQQLTAQMQQAATVLDYERAAQLRDNLHCLEWLRQELERLEQAQQELTFLYPVQAEGDTEIWYFIRQGKVVAARVVPTDPAIRRELAEEITQTFAAPLLRADRTPSPSDLDHIWLVASWFRRHPVERVNVLPPGEAIALLQGVAAHG
jgi:excinuclease ABC subunit C